MRRPNGWGGATAAPAIALASAVLLAGCASDVTGASQRSTTATATPVLSRFTAVPAAALVPVVRLSLANFGDQTPTSVDAVSTTRAIALALVDPAQNSSRPGPDTIPASQPVFLVQATGNFTGAAAKVPPGAAPPRGTELTLIIAADSMLVESIGLTNSPVAIAKAGTPTPLTVR